MKQIWTAAAGFLLGTLSTWSVAAAQQPASALPATAPTQRQAALTAPISAEATPAVRAGDIAGRAEVTCANGQLKVSAENSSLNQILRSISRCTGMRITGGVTDQRVFGLYGPAAPATVLATLLDGTGSNMLLKETAAAQPAELILTPRTGGPTPPSPSSYGEEEAQDSDAVRTRVSQPALNPLRPSQPPAYRGRLAQTVSPAIAAAPSIGPQQIPQPINNPNGSSANTSPTASTYPTANSVPIDSIQAPSTTPPTDGIVDAPNPPPAGSDTAALLNGATSNNPGTSNISPDATSATTTPGATNTTLPADSNTNGTQRPANQGGNPTPEQIYQQLQQLRNQQSQQQNQNQSPAQP